MAHKVGIIGLGVVGRRTLVNMTAHTNLEVVAAWDSSPEACVAAVKDVPGLAVASDAGAVIDSAAEAVYIATPPLFHHEYVISVLAAGKAIFCEKPLGIDVAESRAITDRVEASGLKSAINFVFGSAPAAVELVRKVRAGELGAIAGTDIRLHFAAWPRGWQEAASWLKKRDQGGFVREVVSHFIYLVERMFGPASIAGANIHYPGGNMAETVMTARLDCDGTQVTIAGSVGGLGPDQVECTVWGQRVSYRLSDWYWLSMSSGSQWTAALGDSGDPRAAAYMAQLDNLAAMLDGRPHTMPSFREALRVQEIVEALLKFEG